MADPAPSQAVSPLVHPAVTNVPAAQAADAQSGDPFSRLPDELLGAVFLRAFNDTRFCKTDDDADLQEHVAVELEKVAPFGACNIDVPGAEPLTWPGPAASSLVPFHHALVSKRWLRVARSFHPAIIVPRDRFFSTFGLFSLLASPASRFPNLRHLHLGEFALDRMDDEFVRALSAGTDSPPLENLTHLNIHLYNRRPTISLAPVTPISATDDAVAALLRTYSQLVNLKLVWKPEPPSAFPAAITVLGQLRELTLEGSFTALPEEFGLLTQLKRLRVVAPNLDMLPRTFCLLTSLEVLALFECPMTHLPVDCGQLKELSRIRIANMDRLEDLPPSISLLTALKRLTLQCCSELLLPADFQLPPNLRKVLLQNLSGATVALPDSLGELRSLEELEILDCKYLEQLPQSLSHSSSLRRLEIGMCYQLVLPDDFGELRNVEYLELSWCDFNSLPDSLGCLPAVKEMVISYSHPLQHLPQSVAALESLTSLLLNCDTLKALPEDFGQMSVLAELDLLCERLTVLPESFGQMQELKVLRLIDCARLVELPPSFSNLTALEELSICGAMALTTLPAGFEQLLQLRTLELPGCGIARLPESLGRMTSLEILEVGNRWRYCKTIRGGEGIASLNRGSSAAACALSSFPQSLTLLTRLEKLIMRGCENLVVLPQGMGNLLSLKKLKLKNCPLLHRFPPLFPADTRRRSPRLGARAFANPPPPPPTPLPKLQQLTITKCPLLQNLPDGLHLLPKLECVTISDCERLRLPQQSTLTPLQPLAPLLQPISTISISNAFRSASDLPEILNFSRLAHLPSARQLVNPRLVAETSATAQDEPLRGPPLDHLTSLQSLSLAKTSIASLPDSLSDLVNLRALTIEDCAAISSLPSSISSLRKLQQLHVTSLPLLTSLPDGFGELTGLHELIVTSCVTLRRLPPSLSGLSSLICMIVDDCPQITTIPSSISSLTRLSFLKLSRLPALRELPGSLIHLPSLVILSFKYCSSLQALPSFLGRAPRLRGLQLQECRELRAENLPWSLLEKAGMYIGLESMPQAYTFRTDRLEYQAPRI